MTKAEDCFEVVGGVSTGGIIVRTGKDASSTKEADRLSTGAVLRALEFDGSRLRYELLAGSGPGTGWVSTTFKDKELVVKAAAAPQALRGEAGPAKPSLGFDDYSSRRALMAAVVKDAKAALQHYSEGFGRNQLGEPAVSEGEEEPQPKQGEVPTRSWVRSELERDLGFEQGALKSAEAHGEIRLADPGHEQKPKCAGTGGRNAHEDYSKPGKLLLTFGYAGSLCEQPPHAKFDIRDDVCLQVGGFRHGRVVCDKEGNEFMVVGVKLLDGKPQLWFQPRDLDRAGAGAFKDATAATLRSKFFKRQAFSRPARFSKTQRLTEASLDEHNAAEDSDGEEGQLCCQCRLPVGSFAYVNEDDEAEPLVHGDCWPQVVQQMEQERLRNESATKQARRIEFNIGWKPEEVPRNLSFASKLGFEAAAPGMSCLMLEGDCQKMQVVPTIEPAASVNLEYLSLALQVRCKEGREPRFSLDPLEAVRSGSMKDSMQVKRFEPHWLAGTGAGEVLFQADYHLKELSMGEYHQPVVGMKSCFDMAEEKSGSTSEWKAGWKAREWFVVRNADVQLTKDSVLVPCVKMGVEAREQVQGAHGLEDAAITQPDHPSVKYAGAFTHNFDLIAERKSVFFHLRELAKASVLAKFLLDTGVQTDGFMVNLAEEEQRTGCNRLEIPQLWNERCHSQIHVKDGEIVDAEDDRTHGLYGGVAFGLDVFRIAEAYTEIRGVDLNLDKFSLMPPAQKAAPECGPGDSQLSNPEIAIASAFWSSLEGSESGFRSEDKSLLKAIYNPHLSDRRGESEHFVPPSPGFSNISNLRALVEEEGAVKERRKGHFLSKQFVVGDAGPCFPLSWTSSIEVERGNCSQKVLPGERLRGGLLHARPEYEAEVPALMRVLKLATPTLDKCTEDGTRFRVYRFRSLEVRSTQEPDGDEVIGAIFSIRSPVRQNYKLVGDHEQIVKATEYVERLPDDASVHHYVVLESDQQNTLVTEMLRNGTVTWTTNPEDLEGRNSCAKVIRSSSSGQAGATVGDMKRYQEEADRCECATSHSERKHYAQSAYSRACGEQKRVPGFMAESRRRLLVGSGVSEGKGAAKHYQLRRSEKKPGESYNQERCQELGEMMRFLMAAQVN